MDFRRLTQRQLASAFGITDRAIRLWDDCPRNKDKTYNLPDVIEWRINKAKDEMVGLVPTDPESRDTLDEYRKERVLITRMEREQLEKKLVPVEEVTTAFTERCFELTRRMLLLSRRVAHRVAAASKQVQKKVVDIIDEEVRQAMDEYARPIDMEYEPLRK